MMKKLILSMLACSLFALGCSDDKDVPVYQYYEVGFTNNAQDWRDTAFVVRTADPALIQKIENQLMMDVEDRQLVVGTLVQGSGDYNKNASHEFAWHFDENDWDLADMTIEIYDGRPHTDVDDNLSYWLNTVERFGPWSSYISKRLPGKP